MSNIIQGVKVDGTIYKYDYESLENLPDPELPSSSANDSGKALVVDEHGDPIWSFLPSELPSYSPVNDAGKALVLNLSGSMVWGEVLPACDSDDEGKVLVVDSTGNPAWSDFSGVPGSDSEDEGKVLMVNSAGEPVWNDLTREVPDFDGDDTGKALVVNSTGSLVWRELIPAAGSEGKALVVASNGVPIWKTIIPYSNSGDYGKVLMVADSYGDLGWVELFPTHDTSYEGSDAGKVLTVATNGSLTWEEGGGGGISLPEGSPDEGAVLVAGECGIGLAWGNPFPYHDSSDVGKVLSVDSDGNLVWADPSDLPGTDTDLPTDPT